MIEQGLKITDHNKEDEGYEVNSSIFKVTKIVIQDISSSQSLYRTRAIISRGLYFFYAVFTLAAAYITDN